MEQLEFWAGLAGLTLGPVGLVLALLCGISGDWPRSKAIENALFSAGLLSIGFYLITGMNVFLIPFLGLTLAGGVYQARKKRELRQEVE